MSDRTKELEFKMLALSYRDEDATLIDLNKKVMDAREQGLDNSVQLEIILDTALPFTKETLLRADFDNTNEFLVAAKNAVKHTTKELMKVAEVVFATNTILQTRCKEGLDKRLDDYKKYLARKA